MKLIYLDLNKWIDLSKAYHNPQSAEKYVDIMEVLKKSVERGEVILPLSSMHLVEPIKHFNTSRRLRLGKTMAFFSKGYTISTGMRVAIKELEVACIIVMVITELSNLIAKLTL